MTDGLLLWLLGFFGSFGHCAGMCGPLAIAMQISQPQRDRWRFPLLLNVGRIASYAGVGALLGSLGSILSLGGELAGLGSSFRDGLTVLTGIALICFGLSHLLPQALPRYLPGYQCAQRWLEAHLPALWQRLNQRLNWTTPLALGSVWGLMPCGFLYAAQLQAAAAASWQGGAARMLWFGLGTLPVMLGFGLLVEQWSRDRRSQLQQMAAVVSVVVGAMTLWRSGDPMGDWSGYGALICLATALLARSLASIWSAPLRYRRFWGVSGLTLAILHSAQQLEHRFGWRPEAWLFLSPLARWGLGAGIVAVLLLLPLGLTSSDRWQRRLGSLWLQLHQLAVPAFLLAALHASLLLFSGGVAGDAATQPFLAIAIAIAAVSVLIFRRQPFWQVHSKES
ncbi:sulfite exporter TauE/SafE family protein [Synechococcus elongatus IITB4]|uniref:urease accessory protein UreH domain-containing protein n=1 Tax=Synechococcus elongatus TaxID=32046 RepID=UPI0030CFFB6C